MWYCNCCDDWVDEPLIEWFDYPVPFSGRVERKEYKVCPVCGSTDIEED